MTKKEKEVFGKVDIYEFLHDYYATYDKFYNETDELDMKEFYDLVAFGDKCFKRSDLKDLLRILIYIRGDYFTSDREVAALAYTLMEYKLV